MPTNPLAMSGYTRHALASGKDWVELRNALNWGQQMRLIADYTVVETVTETDAGGQEKQRQQAHVDWGVFRLRQLHAYVRAWSFLNADDQTPLPVSADSISRITPEIGAELDALLDKHLAEVALKNAPKSKPA